MILKKCKMFLHLVLPVITGMLGFTAAASSTPSFNILNFESKCGQANYNCRNGFVKAFKAISAAGGGTLTLPAGTYPVQITEIPSDTTLVPTLTASNLIVVPPNTTIQGTLSASGTLESTIQWTNTSIPTFVFDRSSHSGMKNLHVQFTGHTATNYPYGDTALLTALGYAPTFPHTNQISGGNYEMFAFVWEIDSDYLTFDNLAFDSAQEDNDHIYDFAINMKGKGVLTKNQQHGVTTLGEGSQITNIHLDDFDMGFQVGEQDHLTIENITADHRGSGHGGNIGLGHVVYLSSEWLTSTNFTIENIEEGPDQLDGANSNSGGTLALKFLANSTVDNIRSFAPSGLLQSIESNSGVVYSNLTWQRDGAYCVNNESMCPLWIINFSDGLSKNLTFKNISLISKVDAITASAFTGSNIAVDNLTVISPPISSLKQLAETVGVAGGSSNVTVQGYTYIPILTSAYQDLNSGYRPFAVNGTTTGTKVNMDILWPASVPVPSGTAAHAVTPSVSGSGSALTSALVTETAGLYILSPAVTSSGTTPMTGLTWDLQPMGVTGGQMSYQIVNHQSGMSLDIGTSTTVNGGPVVQANKQGFEQQLWQLLPYGKSYELRSLYSGYCLTLKPGSSSTSSVLVEWQCASGTNQNELWNLAAP